MTRLSLNPVRGVIAAIIVVIIVVSGYFVFFGGNSTKTVTAQFASAVGIYQGTPVRILGVEVGEVTSVKPGAQYVAVTMQYDSKYRIRAKDAAAVEVANSLVSDRYIDLSTLIGAHDPTPALANGAVIPTDRTGGPAELDQIYAQLDKLTTALGPNGANAGGQQSGALSQLLKVSAANLKGNGAALGQSISNLSRAAETLSDNRGNLFATVQNLQKFVATLQANDQQIRTFNEQLSTVSGQLAGERTDLGAALNLLGTALDQVSSFIQANASKFHTSIEGLENITDLLVRQKASLTETLAIAPVALANLVHTYNQNGGTLGTRSNLVSLTSGLTSVSSSDLVCGALKTLTTQVPSLTILGTLSTVVCALSSSLSSGTAKTSSASSKQVSTAEAGTAVSSLDSSSVEALLNGGVVPGTLIGSGS